MCIRDRNYIDGCMITACLSLYKTTGDEKYLEFSKEFVGYFVQPDGAIKTYDPEEYDLDNVNQGKNLFTLYDIFGDEKYRRAIDTIRSQLLTQPDVYKRQVRPGAVVRPPAHPVGHDAKRRERAGKPRYDLSGPHPALCGAGVPQ